MSVALNEPHGIGSSSFKFKHHLRAHTATSGTNLLIHPLTQWDFQLGVGGFAYRTFQI
jgi:hypothetical protein